jgi:hypothetical protein
VKLSPARKVLPFQRKIVAVVEAPLSGKKITASVPKTEDSLLELSIPARPVAGFSSRSRPKATAVSPALNVDLRNWAVKVAMLSDPTAMLAKMRSSRPLMSVESPTGSAALP